MEFNQLLVALNPQNFIPYVFKISTVIFSIFYLLYAIVIYRQTFVMNKALAVKNNFLISLISVSQIAAGVFLTLWSIFLI